MNLEGDQERSGLEPVERETRERYPWLLHSCLIGVCDVPILVPPPQCSTGIGAAKFVFWGVRKSGSGESCSSDTITTMQLRGKYHTSKNAI